MKFCGCREMHVESELCVESLSLERNIEAANRIERRSLLHRRGYLRVRSEEMPMRRGMDWWWVNLPEDFKRQEGEVSSGFAQRADRPRPRGADQRKRNPA